MMNNLSNSNLINNITNNNSNSNLSNSPTSATSNTTEQQRKSTLQNTNM